MAVGHDVAKGKKSMLISLDDSGSSCDDCEIEVVSPGELRQRPDRRASNKEVARDPNEKRLDPEDGKYYTFSAFQDFYGDDAPLVWRDAKPLVNLVTQEAAKPSKKSSYAERRTLLLEQRVKKLEETTTLEFSASDWNGSLPDGAKAKPPMGLLEKRETRERRAEKAAAAPPAKSGSPDPLRKKPSAARPEKSGDMQREKHAELQAEDLPPSSAPRKSYAEKRAELQAERSAAEPQKPVETGAVAADSLPEEVPPGGTPRKSYADRRARLLRCTARVQDAADGPELESIEPPIAAVASDALPSRSKSAVAPVRERETKTPPPRVRAQTNPGRQPRARTPPATIGREREPQESPPVLKDDFERPEQVERERARTNPGRIGKKATLAADISVIPRSRSAVAPRSKRSPSLTSPAYSPACTPGKMYSPAGSPGKKVSSDHLLPFFLASCPAETLADAIIIMKKYGGFYAAGEKDDVFHKDLLMSTGADREEAESWKIGWKGKVEMCFMMIKQMKPGSQIIAIAVAGGPACDWERQQIFTRFCKVHEELQLKQVGDIEDLEAWLLRSGYKPKAVSYGTRKAVGKAAATGKRMKTPPKCGTV